MTRIIARLMLAGLLATPALASAQAPWNVALTPTMNPLPVGSCAAVHMTLYDPVTKGVPRNPQGTLIQMADFDMTVTALDGSSAAAFQPDAYHVSACGCQGAAPGTVATVTATYPAQGLPAAKRVPGVAFQKVATFTLAAPKGTSNPQSCAMLASAPAPQMPAAPASQAPPAAAPPAAAPPAAAPPAAAPPAAAPPAAAPPAQAPPAAAPSAQAPPATPPAAATPPASTPPVALGRDATAPVKTAVPAPVEGPNPNDFSATLLPSGKVLLRWRPVSNAHSYKLVGPGFPQGGSFVGGGANQPNPVTVETGPLPNGTYGWTVGTFVYYPSPGGPNVPGTVAPLTDTAAFTRATLTVTGRTIVNPTDFVAKPFGSGGKVILSWKPVAGVPSYVVFGPGVTNGGHEVSAANSCDATTCNLFAEGVPGGHHTWSVGSYYGPNILSALSAFTTTTLTVTAPVANTPPPPAPLSGKYLVTVTMVRAFRTSVDDMLSRDGKGDEFYVAAAVRRFNRQTGQLADYSVRKTMPHGDVHFFAAQRVQAGTASASGGISHGDGIPSNGLIAMRTMLAQENTFPWKVWEGTLTDGQDALIISPSIWEQDSNDGIYGFWKQDQQSLNLSVFADQSIHNQINQKQFGVLTSGGSGQASDARGGQVRGITDVILMGGGIPIASLLATSHDRPIGLHQPVGSAERLFLPHQIIVLTREIIEATLAGPALGMVPSPFPGKPPMVGLGTLAPKPGTIMIPFVDGVLQGFAMFPENPASYQMFIQVERIP